MRLFAEDVMISIHAIANGLARRYAALDATRNVTQGLIHQCHKFCYRSMISLCILKKVPRCQPGERVEDE
jgi:hypothetical protein